MGSNVSLCMIVRNEEHNLPDCLAQVAGLVDEMIVVDTGSTDRTREMAAGLGAQVYEFPWCDDFSAARNETLRYATKDWIFWLDADDRIDSDNRARLAQLSASLGGQPRIYLMRCLSRGQPGVSPDTWVTHARLFPRHPELRWRYRVHETVLSEELPPNVELQYTDLVIQHSGYQDAAVRRRKLTRDLQLLQRDFTLNPDDPRTLFYLGWSYLELGQTANALRYLRRLAQRQPNNRKLYTLLALCHSQQQQREEALEACRRGLARFPSDVELLYHQGRLLGELGDLEGAESSLLALLTGPAEQYIEFGVTAGLRGPVTRYLLGLLYHQEGRYAECELQLRRALVERPDYIPAWVILGQLYLTLGRTLELDEVVRRLSGCPGGEPYAWVLQARQYLILGALDVARPLLDQALAAAPTLLWARLVLSDLLFQEGRDWEACVQMHQEILAAAPEMDQIRRRLEALLRLSRQPGEPSASSPAEPMGSSEPDLVTVLPQRE